MIRTRFEPMHGQNKLCFGFAETPHLTTFYLRHDSKHDVVGFTVHSRKYMPADNDLRRGACPLFHWTSYQLAFQRKMLRVSIP